jgi:hypothetical protein
MSFFFRSKPKASRLPRISLKEQATTAARDHIEKKIAKEPGALLSMVVWGGFGLLALLVVVWVLRLLTRAR